MAGARFYGAAGAIGLAVGSAVYRWGFLSGVDDPVADALQTIPLVAGLAAFFLIRGLDDSFDKRPPIAPLVVTGLVAAGLVAGVAFAILPPAKPLAEQTLTRRNLPGFSIDLPSGIDSKLVTDYTAGKLFLTKIGRTKATLHLGWQFSEDIGEGEALELGRAAARGAGLDAAKVRVMPAINGAVTLALDAAPTSMMSIHACGGRMIVAASTELGEAMHRKILGSIDCHPDPKLETQTTEMPVWIDLPGYQIEEKGPGNMTLIGDGARVVMRHQPSASITPEMAQKLGEQFLKIAGFENATMGAPKGNLLTFVHHIDGNDEPGFFRFISCPTSNVLLLAMAADRATADELEKRGAAARCLKPGEKAPTWPDYVEPAEHVESADPVTP